MGQHWFLITLAGFAVAGVVGLCAWWIYTRFMSWSARYRYGYHKIPAVISPRGLSPSRARLAVPTLLRRVSFKEDEESAPVTETSYELYSRRD